MPQQTVPDIVCVKGAGGVGISCNGEFCVNGTFKGRPKYKKKGGEAIIYFKECWKLNYQDDTEGWYYSVSGNEPFPPERIWTTEGYDDDDANPAPSVSHGPAEACPIAVIGECQQGQRVRILPAAQAAPAQQGSCAPWSEDCLAHCGDVGEITMVADNGTIRVTFEEGDSYWFAIGACVKVT
ncbi:hypothetical protein EBZ37_08995 [bacterium]|nr:hypothetical protein [bacterium]